MSEPRLMFRPLIHVALSALTALTFIAQSSSAEVIILHDGSSIVGPVLNMGDQDVVVESSEIGRMQIRRTSIKSINGVALSPSATASEPSQDLQEAPPSPLPPTTPTIGSILTADAPRKFGGQVGFGLSNIQVKPTKDRLSSFSGSSLGSAFHWTVASYRQTNGLTYACVLDAWQSFGKDPIRRSIFLSGVGVGWSTSDTSQTGGGMFNSHVSVAYANFKSEQRDYAATYKYDYSPPPTITKNSVLQVVADGAIFGANLSYTHFSNSLLGYFVGASVYGGRLGSSRIYGTACEGYDLNNVDDACRPSPLIVTAAAVYAGLSYKF